MFGYFCIVVLLWDIIFRILVPVCRLTIVHYVLPLYVYLHAYMFKVICMCVCVCFYYHVCVRSMGCNSLWLQPRPLAGKAVGLAGLSRALKQLCSLARLRWWLQARLPVRLKRYSRELLTERRPWDNMRTLSSCLITGSYICSKYVQRHGAERKLRLLWQLICTVFFSHYEW